MYQSLFRLIIQKISATLYYLYLRKTLSSSKATIFFKSQASAMGTKMARSYVDLFIDALERDMLSRYHLTALNYHKYINDTLYIWTHGDNGLHDLKKKHLNNSHHPIKFRMEYSITSILFLDLPIRVNSSHIFIIL